MSHDTVRRAIIDEVSGWPGVEVDAAESDHPQVRYGRIELGHLHGGWAAHLPFPRRIRASLLERGQVGPHPMFPDTGWVERRISGPEDVGEVLALFRMNYERASARNGSGTRREGDTDA